MLKIYLKRMEKKKSWIISKKYIVTLAVQKVIIYTKIDSAISAKTPTVNFLTGICIALNAVRSYRNIPKNSET